MEAGRAACPAHHRVPTVELWLDRARPALTPAAPPLVPLFLIPQLHREPDRLEPRERALPGGHQVRGCQVRRQLSAE